MQIFRPDRVQDAEQQRTILESMAHSLQILRGFTPDTFLGRKTQEPFPEEDLETRIGKADCFRDIAAAGVEVKRCKD